MNSSKYVVRIAWFASLLVCVLLAGQAAAQVAGGTILGTVRDSSGANIPKAEVSLKNTATGVTTTVMTNERGLYRVPNLIPGTYEVSASAGGFATTVATDLILAVGAE